MGVAVNDFDCMVDVYIFSGLGADERVFDKLDFTHVNANFIKWIDPLNNESLANYAIRICEQIRSKNPVLIGLSFGGMIAVEVAKHLKINKLILISSIETRSELPIYFRFMGLLQLHRIFPISLLKKANFISFWFFGVSSKNEKSLLRVILKETNSVFLFWAINSILNWDNKSAPSNSFRIHGTKDRILPFPKKGRVLLIKGGGHFMVLNRYQEVQQYLDHILNTE
jgi:pimeloyl-ACP methyl ester carboxylesterase